MTLYPEENETLVVSHSQEEIARRLMTSITHPSFTNGVPKSLNGWVNEGSFEVTVRTMRRVQVFFPLVRGRIEATSKGSLVFMTYSLFPGTRLLLSFWTIVLALGALGLAYELDTYIWPVSLVAFLLFMQVIARANFKLHQKTTRDILHQLFR